jgi:hypothetical protein
MSQNRKTGGGGHLSSTPKVNKDNGVHINQTNNNQNNGNCAKCIQTITNPDNDAYSCAICTEYTCLSCLDMTKVQLGALQKLESRADFMWVCHKCYEAVQNLKINNDMLINFKTEKNHIYADPNHISH